MFGIRRTNDSKSKSNEKTVPRTGNVKVVRSMTLPNGKTVRVVRKDVFRRAIERTKSEQPA